MANFTTRQRIMSSEEVKGRCGYCGDVLNDYFEMDHVIPKSKHGSGSRKNNILAACGRCNRAKTDKGLSYLKSYLKIKKFWFERIGLKKGDIQKPSYKIGNIIVHKPEMIDPYAWELESHLKICREEMRLSV